MAAVQLKEGMSIFVIDKEATEPIVELKVVKGTWAYPFDLVTNGRPKLFAEETLDMVGDVYFLSRSDAENKLDEMLADLRETFDDPTRLMAYLYKAAIRSLPYPFQRQELQFHIAQKFKEAVGEDQDGQHFLIGSRFIDGFVGCTTLEGIPGVIEEDGPDTPLIRSPREICHICNDMDE